jgi:hypothetical protein
MAAPVRLRATLERKDPRLPVFVVVPGPAIAEWGLTTTTTVEGNLNGRTFGRRSIKVWGKDSPDWFVEFTRPFLESAGLVPGDVVDMELSLADMSPPIEITRAIEMDPHFACAWKALKPLHQRAAIEYCLDAKTPAGRARRLAKIASSIGAPA